MKFCMKAATALAALALTAVPIWAKPNIAELAHKCDSLSKQKACRELAKLAEHDKDTSVRIEAINKLSDEAVLLRIVERDLFPAVRQAAEARLKTIRSKKGNQQAGGTAGQAAQVGASPAAAASTQPSMAETHSLRGAARLEFLAIK